jgi:DNA-binding CsgD family transcriptional regulator
MDPDPNHASNLLFAMDAAIERMACLSLHEKAEDLADFVRTIVNSVKIKHVACLRFAYNKSEDVTLLSGLFTYSKNWQIHYFVKRYQLVDPIVVVGRTAAEPFDWQSLRKLSPEVSSFFADASEHGVGANGITIPVRNRHNGFSLVSLTSDLPDLEWEAFRQENIKKLGVLAVLIDSAAGISARLPADEVRLSMREEQSLAWAARGKTVQETADIMDVAYGSVRTYLDTARAKLKCINVTHAVAVAIATGLIPASALKGTDPKGFSENSARETPRRSL